MLKTLPGKLSSGVQLTGRLSAASSHSYPPYTGDYEVTPKTTPQTLETAGKVLAKDIAVNAIPYFETSNEQDGWTVYIAEEV
ncbi:hypothetical protein CE91St42_14680 [Oscillospiraceae bacterium]|nr:hypothetical protein CE91St42_14680 [Oscillospiraceae bacterium]